MRFLPSAVLGIALATAMAAACNTLPTTLLGSGGGQALAGQCSAPQAVEQLIGTCVSCHDASGTSPPLTTIADLQAMSPQGVSYAERSITRMTDTNNSMPPGAPPAASEVAAFKAWVNAGFPVTCPTTANTTTGTSTTSSVSTTSSTTVSAGAAGGAGTVSP